VPKSDDAKKRICEKLDLSFMFQHLDKKEKDIVIDAMEECYFKANECVIKEGDQGEVLYIVETGILSCTKIFPGNTEPTFLKKFNPGDAFGELALLYNAPRAATIVSDADAHLWSLDRGTFNAIVKGAQMRKMDRYEKFLGNVKILASMDPYERSKLAEAFKEETHSAGATIIKEGDEGNCFYLVEEGSAAAVKGNQEVMQYAVGDYFGERALLKNEPRAASVIAKSNCVVVSMDRHSFKRLLGNLDDILKRNMELYEQYK
jgi:cAMP-dependent protein kinase regulator